MSAHSSRDLIGLLQTGLQNGLPSAEARRNSANGSIQQAYPWCRSRCRVKPVT